VVNGLLSATAVPALVYAAILVLLTVDAFIPVVPTQALMIGGGVLTAHGNLQLALVVAAGALGAFSGDLACFGIGRRLARRDAGAGAEERPVRFRRLQRLSGRLTGTMRRHLFLAILFCRFVPAGRMVTSANAGRNGYDLRRFLTFDLIAVTLWASYGALLGHFGSQALTSSSWLPLVLIGVAAAVMIGAAPLISLIDKARGRTA